MHSSKKHIKIVHVVQSLLAKPHTFVPQDIVQINESTGLLNQFE